jgi:hypothetical protein
VSAATAGAALSGSEEASDSALSRGIEVAGASTAAVALPVEGSAGAFAAGAGAEPQPAASERRSEAWRERFRRAALVRFMVLVKRALRRAPYTSAGEKSPEGRIPRIAGGRFT